MTAQTIVAEWIDHCQIKPPRNIIGQVSKQVKNLLDEGYAPDLVLRAVAEWNSKAVHPSVLPSILHGIGNRSSTPRRQVEVEDQTERWLKRATADRSA